MYETMLLAFDLLVHSTHFLKDNDIRQRFNYSHNQRRGHVKGFWFKLGILTSIC